MFRSGFNGWFSREQMCKPRILLSGLSWQLHYQRINLACAQRVQRFLGFFHAREVIESRTARANLANRLRAAQHQDAHHRELSRVELQDFRRDMFVFWDATRAAMKHIGKVLFAQTVERALDLSFA